jgi:transposase InsO family protein
MTTTRPDEMWGADATRFYTEEDGWCWFFGAIDHYVDELVGWHTAKIGDRWAALEPLRHGVRHVFGRFAKDVARGVRIHCDWGPQYIADAWINEVKWLGMTISASYVGEPECNGVMERFMRTLKSCASISIASRIWRKRGGSSATSSPATTPNGSSSGLAIRRPWPRARRCGRRDQ